MKKLEEKLNELINIVENISIKYKQLKTMEQSGMKDENVFKSICVELNNLYKLENEFYKNNIFNDRELLEMMELLIIENTFDPNDTMEDILHNTKNFNHHQRIFEHLRTILQYDTKKNEKEINNIPVFLKSVLPIDKTTAQMKANILFEKTILNNYYLVLESFICRYLENDSEYKDELINLKYLLPFLNSEIESEFINNNFDFNRDLYLNYSMIGDYYGIPRNVQNIKLNDNIFIIFAEESARLLSINDKDVDNFKFDIILSKIILRSTTIFFKEDYLNIRKEAFFKFVKENYLELLNYKNAVKSITNIYNNTKKDKSNYKYLSLKPF